jgi:phage gp46-like protein
MAIALKILDDTILAPNLLWDTVWDGFVGDYAPAAPGEPSNRGGLRARAPLETAALLCLMSDARATPSDRIPDGSGDPRGWAGDLVDPDAAPLGSKLWLLRRSELTDTIAERAALYARSALQTLVDQGAVATITVIGTANLAAGRLELTISMFKRDGTLAAAPNFSILWDMNRGIQHPLDR